MQFFPWDIWVSLLNSWIRIWEVIWYLGNDTQILIFPPKTERMGYTHFCYLNLQNPFLGAPSNPPKFLHFKAVGTLLHTFLLIATPIFTWFSSVLPFWKAEGLTIKKNSFKEISHFLGHFRIFKKNFNWAPLRWL